tara:strand:- start:32 stop:274 length:243 start_codon:yes stop_codon:yes gene_type:complete
MKPILNNFSIIVRSRAGSSGLPSLFYEEVIWNKVIGIGTTYHVRNVVEVILSLQIKMVQATVLVARAISKTIKTLSMGIS